MQTDSATHYNEITTYMYYLNKIKNFGKADPTFHKIINVPLSWRLSNPGALPSNYIHDVILSFVDVPTHPLILDAGCGFGGTIFWLNTKHPGIYHGVSISSVQIQYAKKMATKYGKEKDCIFFEESYDTPRPFQYDIIIAIESLLHSKNLSITINNLSNCLKNGGKLVLIEDMIEENFFHHEEDFSFLLNEWSISHFPTYNEYLQGLTNNQLHILVDQDLTTIVKLMDRPRLRLIKYIGQILSRAQIANLRKIGCFHQAQMILHEMYHNHMIAYRILIAEK